MWEQAYTLSVIGNAFLFVFIAFSLETENNVENQFLRLFLIAFAFIFGFAAIAANIPIQIQDIGLTDDHSMMNAIRAVYIPYIALLIFLLIYSVWFFVKRVIQHMADKKKLEDGNI